MNALGFASNSARAIFSRVARSFEPVIWEAISLSDCPGFTLYCVLAPAADAASDADTASQPSSAGKPGINLAKALGLLVLVGLASPFLELQNPLNGALGLLILFIGINIAWRLTAGPKIEILGPFAASTSPAPQSGT